MLSEKKDLRNSFGAVVWTLVSCPWIFLEVSCLKVGIGLRIPQKVVYRWGSVISLGRLSVGRCAPGKGCRGVTRGSGREAK